MKKTLEVIRTIGEKLSQNSTEDKTALLGLAEIVIRLKIKNNKKSTNPR